MLLEKTLESPLDYKEIKSVHSKGNQYWIIIGSTDAEAETPILWPPDMKRQLIRKDPDAGGDWRQEEKEMTEDEMVRCHHGLNRTWVWASSGRWWRTRKPGVLQSMRLQRVRHNWATEQVDHIKLIFIELFCTLFFSKIKALNFSVTSYLQHTSVGTNHISSAQFENSGFPFGHPGLVLPCVPWPIELKAPKSSSFN